MLNEINRWQCEKRKGEEKTPNPYKIRIMLAASCSHLKRIADNKQQNADDKAMPALAQPGADSDFCFCLISLFLSTLVPFLPVDGEMEELWKGNWIVLKQLFQSISTSGSLPEFNLEVNEKLKTK